MTGHPGRRAGRGRAAGLGSSRSSRLVSGCSRLFPLPSEQRLAMPFSRCAASGRARASLSSRTWPPSPPPARPMLRPACRALSSLGTEQSPGLCAVGCAHGTLAVSGEAGASGAQRGLPTSQERLPCRPRAATGSPLAPSSCLRPGPVSQGVPGRSWSHTAGVVSPVHSPHALRREQESAKRSSAGAEDRHKAHGTSLGNPQVSRRAGRSSPRTNSSDWQRLIKMEQGASLVAQWLRVCLPMQGTRVRALVWEDPTCHGAAGPVSHSC